MNTTRIIASVCSSHNNTVQLIKQYCTDGTYHQVKKPLCETECEICYILNCFAVPLHRNTYTYKNNATSTKELLSKVVQKSPTVLHINTTRRRCEHLFFGQYTFTHSYRTQMYKGVKQPVLSVNLSAQKLPDLEI